MNRHFILTHGRSGSNFLVNSLNLHPEIVNYGEVLGSWTLPSKFRRMYAWAFPGWEKHIDIYYYSSLVYYLAQLWSAVSHLIKIKKVNFKPKFLVKSIGIKVFVFLLKDRGCGDYLNSNRDVKVIYLTRRNYFNRYISLLNMQEAGIVFTELGLNNRAGHKAQLNIDVIDLLDKISVFKGEEEEGDNIISKLTPGNVLLVDYDDYLSDRDSVLITHNKIFKFIGVKQVDVRSSHKKIITGDIRQYISNYAEVKSAMITAGFGGYLPK